MTPDQTVVTARMPFIQSAHTEVVDGTCGLCDVVWPCDAGVVLAELARLTGDGAALRERLAAGVERDRLVRTMLIEIDKAASDGPAPQQLRALLSVALAAVSEDRK